MICFVFYNALVLSSLATLYRVIVLGVVIRKRLRIERKTEGFLHIVVVECAKHVRKVLNEIRSFVGIGPPRVDDREAGNRRTEIPPCPMQVHALLVTAPKLKNVLARLLDRTLVYPSPPIAHLFLLGSLVVDKAKHFGRQIFKNIAAQGVQNV